VTEQELTSELSKITSSNFDKPIVVCYKSITFGGGEHSDSRSHEERRIQIQYTNNNRAFESQQNGETAILIGLSDSDDIFCAWKLNRSEATQGTISKQIKQTTIDAALKSGIARQKQRSKDEYTCAFRKEFIYFYIQNLEWLHGKSLDSITDADMPSVSDVDIDGASVAADETPPFRRIDESTRKRNGTNYLLYGVPGSGKSHTVKTEYCDDEERMERVVFHPDYTYSDFVGQIMPKLDEKRRVYYDFSPGPFTRILKKAYTTPSKEFYLVIEELNRGNAPAIFGEVFQLLDRKERAEEGAIGESSYGITNAYVASMVYGNPDYPILIPSNLSIVATMNTSDQNVFTLDTAFQRRWRMRMIENNISKAIHAQKKILDTTVTWEQFNTDINKLILEANTRLSSSEDKRLGAYFVTPLDLESSTSTDTKEADKQNSRFPEKVLKYLWDDAFKFTREVIFDTDNYQSLEEVIRTFKMSEGNARFKKIFKESVLGGIGD
jgi:MoxR-like ATPase